MILIATGTNCDRINLDIKDVMGIMTEKLDILARMRINLLKSVEAEKMGVIAEKKAGIIKASQGAYSELAQVTVQVIELSRQNTNIKSFELSLGRKRKLTAQCDEILNPLQEAVHSRSFKATR